MDRISELNVLDAALDRWPDASEVHIQFHTHVVGTRLGTNYEGVCVCAVEGYNVRRQFTAETPARLLAKVVANEADWKDASDLAMEMPDYEDQDDLG